MSGALTEGAGRVTVSHRVIADQIPRAGARMTLTVRAHPRLTVGVEYNPLADDVGPLANLVAVTETRSRPAIIIGTSSDRIGTPSGRSYYVTASKSLEVETGLAIAPYFGVAYGEYEDRLRPIGGTTVHFSHWLSAMAIFDGVKVHPLLTFSRGKYTASFLLAHGRDPGVSYSISF